MSQNSCVVDGEKPEVDKLSVLISFSDTTFLLFVVLVFLFRTTDYAVFSQISGVHINMHVACRIA